MNGVGDTVRQPGFIFKPSLQDISLKRFRMRYSTPDDCYYLHWDDAVCTQLAKFEGLTNGVLFSRGMQRYRDESKGMVFLGSDSEKKTAQICWKFDFRDCGLAVRHFKVKGRCSDDEDIEWRVIGDDRVGCRPLLGVTDDYIDIPEVYGCRYVTVTAVIYQRLEKEPAQLLMGEKGADCPLDVKVDLMCHRPQEEGYVGEILLGIKWSPNTDDSKEDIVSDHSPGQLQVYIVEGAGMMDEDTRKPFNAFIKCHLLPEGSKQQTSPRQTAFPSWAKQFHFYNLEKEDLINGGLEILLCDSHLLYKSNIGGLRLCVPQKNERRFEEMLEDASPVISRSGSPASIMTVSDVSDDGADSPPHPLAHRRQHSTPSPINLSITSPERSKSLTNPKSVLVNPKILRSHARSFDTPSSPTLGLQRSLTPTPSGSSPHVLSPTFLRRTRSPSPSSKPSPRAIAKAMFRLSGSHLRDFPSSPLASPTMPRKKVKGHRMNEDSEYLYYWMADAGDTEMTHWKKMLDQEGDWVYCWHVLKPKLKPAYS